MEKGKKPTIYERIRDFTASAILVYTLAVPYTKTGHPSADLALGLSKPTQLEKMVINFVADTFDVKIPKKYR